MKNVPGKYSRKIQLGEGMQNTTVYWEKRDEKRAEEEGTDSSLKSEETINEELHAYLSQSLYPLESTKQEVYYQEVAQKLSISIWCSALEGQGRVFAASK